MFLHSCHRAVITDWAILDLMLSFSLIKIKMKSQPVQIAEVLCSASFKVWFYLQLQHMSEVHVR